jgi:hypothetical protein
MLLLAYFNVVQSFPVCTFPIPCAMCAQESEGHKIFRSMSIKILLWKEYIQYLHGHAHEFKNYTRKPG